MLQRGPVHRDGDRYQTRKKHATSSSFNGAPSTVTGIAGTRRRTRSSPMRFNGAPSTVTGIEVAEDLYDLGDLQCDLRAGSGKADVNVPRRGDAGRPQRTIRLLFKDLAACEHSPGFARRAPARVTIPAKSTPRSRIAREPCTPAR